MIKFFNLSLLTVFVLVLAAPATSFFLDGREIQISRNPVAFTNVGSVFAPAPQGRKSLVSAILDRTPLRFDAISIKNRISYTILGDIETSQVISGEPGWLFLKGQFTNWGCERRVTLDSRLERAKTVMIFAEAANANVTFVLAPNKASVERKRLTGRAARYAPCYFDFEHRFRSFLQDVDVHTLIDHADALETLNTSQQKYYQHDTHWAPEGSYAALLQLRDALADVQPVPRGGATTQALVERRTDLGNNMLRLLKKEEVMDIDPAHDSRPDVGEEILIVHDSFYQIIKSKILTLFPAATMLSLNRTADLGNDNLKKYKHIVIESVERHFLRRMSVSWSDSGGASVGWGTPIGDHILDQSALAANRCDWTSAVDILSASETAARTNNIEFVSDTKMSATRDPQIRFRVPDTKRTICIAAEFTHSEETRTQLFLARKHRKKDGPIFSEGQSVLRILPPGRSRLVLVMPDATKGSEARFDPVSKGDFELHSFQYAFGPNET